MAYLGRQPIIGNYQVLDAITASATATYALTKGGVAVFPQTPANCIVSLNGVIQAPFDSYTISGSNIVFASALTGSDSIDFITVLGDVLNVGTVSDGTITSAKLADSSVSLAKLTATGTKDATTFLRGDNTFASAQGKFESQLLHIRDERAANTAGGAASAGDNVRTLNTIVTNEISGASISSNQITLPSGTYYIQALTPIYSVNQFRTFLYNSSDSSVELLGINMYSRGSAPSVELGWLLGRFTISAQKVFEIRTHCQTAVANAAALGFPSGDGRASVHVEAQIWRTA